MKLSAQTNSHTPAILSCNNCLASAFGIALARTSNSRLSSIARKKTLYHLASDISSALRISLCASSISLGNTSLRPSRLPRTLLLDRLNADLARKDISDVKHLENLIRHIIPYNKPSTPLAGGLE
ncbi:hypothetical protein RRF57_012603 [Xylaria bambusicola]|uniref:Uncharacterized protein n=1 Tax=Xylaria bambusicola TaxID=326684 RepID=A0AAN7ZDT3_9PEZI